MNESQPHPHGESSRAASPGGAAPGFFRRLFHPAWLEQVPSRLWARVLFVFAALCLVKCALIFSLRHELYQAHWRVNDDYPRWFEYPALVLLAVLFGGQLWVFGRRCAERGLAAVRGGFAVLVTLAAAFVLLTFHEGDKSYLAAVANAILQFSDLKAYLALNSFFRPPFLAVWLAALGLAYVWAVRTGREGRMIQVFAVMAAAYFVVHLRDMTRFQTQLLVLAAFAAASLLSGIHLDRRLRWMMVLAPWCLIGCKFALFGPVDPLISAPMPEFMILLGLTGALFLGGTLVARRLGFYDAWSLILPSMSVAFTVLALDHFAVAANYRNLAVLGLGLPRYFIGEAVLSALMLAAGAAYLRRRQKGSLWWLDAFALVALGLAVMDCRLAQIMGIRLDWQVLSSADINSPVMLWRMAQPFLAPIAGLLALTVLVYWAFLRWAARWEPAAFLPRLARSNSWRYALSAGLLLGVTGLLILHPDKAEGQALGALVRTSTWIKRLGETKYSPEKFIAEARHLGMDSMLAPVPAPSRPRRDLNVVLIFQESVYNKHLSLFGGTNDTQPRLARYRDRMELFPNFHSNFAKSMHARFATFAGLYPVQEHEDFTRRPVPVKSLFEILNDQGYECSMFYSSFFDYTNFRDFLRGRGLAKQFEADTMPGERKTERVMWGLKEGETLGAIREQIRAYGTNHAKFFLTYVPAAPHHPFDGVPEEFKKYAMRKIGDLTPRYLNELLYMDWVITEILRQLEDSGLLDKTLVVITSDHGEMTGDNNGILGHGWTINPELTNVPLILLDPANRQFRVNPVPASQVDLLPTVVDLLGLPLPEGQFYQGVSLLSPAAAQPRNIFLNSHRQFAVLNGHTMLCGDREADAFSAGGVYQFTNSLRGFQYEQRSVRPEPFDIRRFEKFQLSLLRYYAEYVRTVPRATNHTDSAAVLSQ